MLVYGMTRSNYKYILNTIHSILTVSLQKGYPFMLPLAVDVTVPILPYPQEHYQAFKESLSMVIF